MNLRAPARFAGVLALLLAACGTPPEATTAPQPTEQPPGATPSALPAVSAAAASPAVQPDTPKEADAAREAELVKAVESIYDVTVNSSPRLTPDGKKLVFRSSRDGLPQLYIADTDKPDAPATRLTKLKERVGEFEITPDGKAVIFLSDKGADENFFLFRIGLDGAGPVGLTESEVLHRDTPVLPDQAPGTMVYSARDVKEKTSRLYVQGTADGAAPKLVYTDPSPATFLVDASRDGKQGLLVRLTSTSDAKLLLADLGAGTTKLAYPAEGKVESVLSALFSSDGSTLFVATDGGGEQAILLALDAKTLREKGRYVETKPATARIEDFTVSKKGDRLGLLIDAGNRSEVRLLDAKTLKPATAVAMPLGTGGGLRFSEDGSRLTLQWSTPSAPLDLYAVDVKTGKAKELRKEPRPTLANLAAIDVSITEVASFDGKKVPVNVYLPKGLAKGKKLPTLVAIHGGPASSSAVRWSLFTRFYLAQGFAVVEPNVRGSTGFGRAYEQADDGPKRMDAVRDMEAVGMWAAGQPWADEGRLVVLGGSYGGYMTLMGVAHHPKLWKAGVDVFGIYSWRTLMKTTSGVIRDVFQKEIGKEDDPAFLDAISPSSAVDKIAAPLFVYAGQNDPRVPRAESDQLVASLRARKVPVEYMVAANEGHSLDRKENVTAFLARSTRFLEKTLKIEK